MYRIKVINCQTDIIFYEYGFSSYIMKRLHFLFNYTDSNGYSYYEVLDISRLCFSLETFKKCLTTSFIDHTDFDYETIIDELKKNT
jgi:hypothetical protein